MIFPFSFWQSAGAPPPPSISLVQHTNKDSVAATVHTLAYGSNNAAGNLAIVAFRISSNTPIVSVVDTNLNIYTLAESQTDISGGLNTIYIYYAKNIGAGANTVTITLTGSAACRVAIYEVSGCSASAPLDVHTSAHNTVSGTAISSGNVTTTVANEFLIGILETASVTTFTGGSGWTSGDIIPAAPNSRAYVQYQIVSSTGTFTSDGSSTLSDLNAAAIATFK